MSKIRASSVAFRRRLRSVLEKLPAFLALGLLWELLARQVASPFVPPLTTIFGRFVEDWVSSDVTRAFTSEKLIENLLPTLGRLGAGWGIAIVVGISLGLWLGHSNRADAILDPAIRWGMSVPPPALLPLAIVLVGLGGTMKVLFIAFGCVWPVLVNTIAGVKAVDPTVRNTARTLHLRPIRALLQVTVPAASPRIFAGLRTSLAAAIIFVVVAELYVSSSGIGYVIVDSQRNFDILGTWSGILLLGGVGIAASSLFLFVESQIMRWHFASRRLAQ
jgi:ABC-type nitrate/sulfonate/bicarbonate transport system permease component